MAMKQPGRKGLRGKPVDMALLQKRNELTPAVGNARVNARGGRARPWWKDYPQKRRYAC